MSDLEEHESIANSHPRPTMRDVAALAGVGIKTVSRVVNDETGVTPAKVTAVQRAVQQLGYRPNLSASQLRRTGGKTAAIGAVLEDVANPFFSSLHRALEDVARERDVTIFAGSVDEDPERERDLVRAFTMRRADALVIAPTGEDQSYLYPDLQAGTPVVFVDRAPRGITADTVVSANEPGANEAVRHLASYGHRDIAYLGDRLSIATAVQRFRGYREACADLGLQVSPQHQVHQLHSADDAAHAVTELLSSSEPPTALFTSQNLVTIGAVRALYSLGLESRVALVGFDDFPMAELLKPGVTAVAQYPKRIGQTAAALVFRRLSGDTSPAITRTVPTTLIARGTGEIRPTGST